MEQLIAECGTRKHGGPRANTLRVTRLLPVLDYGGAETTVVQQATQMERAGLELRVCTFWKEGTAAKKIRGAGIPVDCLDVDPSIRNPKATIALWRYLRKRPADILHCTITESNFHGTLVGKFRPDCRIIVEEVGDPSQRSWKAHGLVGLTMHLADHCIGVSRPSADYISKQLQVAESKISHIDNGITALKVLDEQRRVEVRRELGIGEDALVIGSVGRLDDEVKRFTDMVDALALIDSPDRDVQVLLVGDGRDREKIEEYIRRRGFDDQVILTGYRSDTERMYAAMDIFCLLSAHEAFGLVVAEAMFCELPVVVSDVGGMSGVVVEGKTGFKGPPFKPDKAARRLDTLLESEDLRSSMGCSGRKRAMERYSSERYVRELRELYFRLAASDD